MSKNLPDRFSDEHARAILARAIDIDARHPLTTADELRAIAAEIGVSPTALETALREHITSMRTRRIATDRRAAAALTSLGVPLGVTAGLLLGSGAGLPALAVMAAGLVASGGLVVVQGSTGSLR